MTYHQVASNPDIHRAHCRQPTLFIGDEIHHAGDDRTWGNAIKEAFDPAVRRLLLSGTPFRQPKMGAIPFVQYTADANGIMRSVADFSYGYGAALRDGVCRPVLFPSYEGKMEWMSGLDTIRASFVDELPEDDSRHRLRTALDVKGEWLPTVIRDANQRLTELRANGDPLAGGLILCIDAAHARAVAAMLHRVTGETGAVILSEDDGASQRLTAYAKSHDRWLVAVRMVSEGIDIPRLRVGVYATNTLTELFFRQVVGRFIRVISDAGGEPTPEEQSAFVYIPKEAALVAWAERIKEERDHALAEEIEEIRRSVDEGKERQAAFFQPITAEAQADDVVFDEQRIAQAEIEEARLLAIQVGIRSVPPELIARLLRLRATHPPVAPVVQPASVFVPPTLMEQKARLRTIIKRMVTQLVVASKGTLDWQGVNTSLLRIDGCKIDQATTEQLDRRIDILKDWIGTAKAQNG